jgi:hypothetical protein
MPVRRGEAAVLQAAARRYPVHNPLRCTNDGIGSRTRLADEQDELLQAEAGR